MGLWKVEKLGSLKRNYLRDTAYIFHLVVCLLWCSYYAQFKYWEYHASVAMCSLVSHLCYLFLIVCNTYKCDSVLIDHILIEICTC